MQGKKNITILRWATGQANGNKYDPVGCEQNHTMKVRLKLIQLGFTVL